MWDSGKDFLVYIGKNKRKNGLFYLAGFVVAAGLKQFYRCAGAADLQWILAPVAHLVGPLAGISFQWDPSTGFVSHSREIVIAPACAGVNFLIICFATLFFGTVSRLRGSRRKWACFGLSAVAAYVVTLVTNTVRILLSFFLYDAPIYGGAVTPGRVHHLAGTVIYVGILLVLFLAAERLARRFDGTGTPGRTTRESGGAGTLLAPRSLPLPFTCYALIMIVVPLLNGAAARNGSRFAEHVALVLAVCLSMTMIPLFTAALLKKRVDRVEKTKEKNGRGRYA